MGEWVNSTKTLVELTLHGRPARGGAAARVARRSFDVGSADPEAVGNPDWKGDERAQDKYRRDRGARRPRTSSSWALPQIDDERRRLVLERTLDGVPADEIAAELGVSMANLYAIRSRAHEGPAQAQGPVRVMSEPIDHGPQRVHRRVERGERPRVDDYLDRVAAERARRARRPARDWLLVAPTPGLLREALAADQSRAGAGRRARRDRGGAGAVARGAAAPAGARGAAPARPRSARRPRRSDWAERRSAPSSYLERMERGDLDAARVSRRLLEALGARSAEPNPGRAGSLAGAPAPRPGAVPRRGRRRRELRATTSSPCPARRSPAPAPMDELDRLFVGGPDG